MFIASAPDILNLTLKHETYINISKEGSSKNDVTLFCLMFETTNLHAC